MKISQGWYKPTAVTKGKGRVPRLGVHFYRYDGTNMRTLCDKYAFGNETTLTIQTAEKGKVCKQCPKVLNEKRVRKGKEPLNL